jgi:hypothetical protein
MGSDKAECSWRRLTPEKHLSRLVLLNLDLVCGNFLEVFHCQGVETNFFLSSLTANEPLPG